MTRALLILLATTAALAANPAPPNKPAISLSDGCNYRERAHCTEYCRANAPDGSFVDGSLCVKLSHDYQIPICGTPEADVPGYVSPAGSGFLALLMPSWQRAGFCAAPHTEQNQCWCRWIDCSPTWIEGVIPVRDPRCPRSA